MDKTRFCFAALILWAGTAGAGIALQFTDIADGMTSVLHVTHANDGSNRVFLVQRSGVIWIYDNGGVLPNPFLDISDQVSGGSERGMFSMAFPPGLGPKDHFYVDYTDNDGDVIVSRFGINQNPNVANANSEQQIIRIAQPQSNHNGGHIAFGPDGMLYISSGDGGGAGDPQGAGQRLNTLLGKILRIDVSGGGPGYAVPADNPFAGAKGGAREEIWAYGLRNPWRIAFDRVTGEFYIADVGQDIWEEINRQPANSPGGENYGWNEMEGPVCFLSGCNPLLYTPPVESYNHDEGCSITGGHVYRGSRYPALEGLYLYGDYCSGRIWGLDSGLARGVKGGGVELADTDFLIVTFGQDQAGNVYVSDQSGGVYLISDGAPVLDTVAIGPQHSASWYGGPLRDGEGFLIEVLPTGQLVVYWFTYDSDGNQIWVVGVGNIVGEKATVQGFITDGGVFGPAFDPDDVNRTFWGTLTFMFDGCNSGSMSYESVSFGSGQMDIVRLTELAGLSC
ncbi:MAG: glucose dehydrogenase [Gammaproteobacteria bacterium]|nr:MAG: glucose dehydrogenase [Gammaproteobacteria bacterium]